MPESDLIVSHKALPQGFEFHLSSGDAPRQSLCDQTVVPTQIPPFFWAVDSAIEGRWCERCEALSRKLEAVEPPPPAVEMGDAPCV